MFFKNLYVAVLVVFLACLPAHDVLAQQKKSVTVVNNTHNTAIWKIHFSSTNETEWGPDQLGDDFLWPGSAKTWTIPWRGCWIDIQAITIDDVVVSKKINVCGGGTWRIFD